MKKTIIIVLLGILTFLRFLNVNAEQLEMEYVNNPYYYREWENSTDTGKLTFYNVDGKVAYCVEPGVHITDSTYLEASMDMIGISEDVLKDIKRIGYYGYEYPGHERISYRMATQALIWERLRKVQVSYWTGKDATGFQVDVEKEKEEILNLVNRHTLEPAISKNLTLSKEKEYVLTDTNDILDTFEIENNNSNLEVFKEGNRLHIKGEVGDYEITLKKIKYDNESSILYVGSDGISQKLMKLRIDEDFCIKMNIHIVGGKIILHKLDSETKTSQTIGNSTLMSAVYGIYDEENKLLDTIKTDESGEGVSSLLKLGKYVVKELSPSYGYELDSKSYEIELTVENLEKDLEVYESLKKIPITIIKTLEGDYSLLEGEKDIIFEIYWKDTNQLFQRGTTNEFGVAKLKLPYGKYLFHQVNTQDGYLKGEDFEIVVDDQNEEIYKVVYDKRVGNLKIFKYDSKTSIPLSNAFFELYRIEDNALIKEGYTNEEGILEFKDLFLGKYKLIEKEAPMGYILNTKEYEIDLSKDTKELILSIPNNKIEIEVPNTSLNELKSRKYLGGVGLMIGLFFLFISKLKVLKK